MQHLSITGSGRIAWAVVPQAQPGFKVITAPGFVEMMPPGGSGSVDDAVGNWREAMELMGIDGAVALHPVFLIGWLGAAPDHSLHRIRTV